MCDKSIELSQGPLDSLRVALPLPLPQGKRGESTAKHGTLPEFLYQCHLEVGDQVTGHM